MLGLELFLYITNLIFNSTCTCSRKNFDFELDSDLLEDFDKSQPVLTSRKETIVIYDFSLNEIVIYDFKSACNRNLRFIVLRIVIYDFGLYEIVIYDFYMYAILISITFASEDSVRYDLVTELRRKYEKVTFH